MSRYRVAWDTRASVELLRARARLGVAGAADLDRALEHVRELLGTFPRLGGPAWLEGRWHETVRRLIVGETGYLLFYRVFDESAVVFVLSIRHEKQRPPKL